MFCGLFRSQDLVKLRKVIVRKHWTELFCFQPVSLVIVFLSFQMLQSLVHSALMWIPQGNSLYCSNCSTIDRLPFYHSSENTDDCLKNEGLFSGHILILNKRTLKSTPITHQAQKPSCPHQTGGGPKRAGTRVRKAEVLGNGGTFIMWMI